MANRMNDPQIVRLIQTRRTLTENCVWTLNRDMYWLPCTVRGGFTTMEDINQICTCGMMPRAEVVHTRGVIDRWWSGQRSFFCLHFPEVSKEGLEQAEVIQDGDFADLFTDAVEVEEAQGDNGVSLRQRGCRE
jgi:hypothetical protein